MDTALKKIKSIKGLSRRIALRLKVAPSTVSRWKKVPPKHVRATARITGMTPKQLRPDIFG